MNGVNAVENVIFSHYKVEVCTGPKNFEGGDKIFLVAGVRRKMLYFSESTAHGFTTFRLAIVLARTSNYKK